MRHPALTAVVAAALSSTAAFADPAAPPWDPARVAQTVNARARRGSKAT